jgi:hypothetical protein
VKALLTFLFIFSGIASAMTSNEELLVRSVKWNENKKMYRVSFYEKAGIYYSPKKNIKCLTKSIQKTKPVTIRYNLKSLIVKECK